jgi:hypothetical protein
VGLAPTKQNVMCERKSVSEVIFSHDDFKGMNRDRDSWFPNTRRLRNTRVEPTISLIRRDKNYDEGYAFLFEDSASMREFVSLHVVHTIRTLYNMPWSKKT